MIDTRKIADYRKLRFASIDECIAEVDRIVASDRAGTLRRLGNWTPGRIFAHLAAWIEYNYVGFPMKPPPFFIRWLIKLSFKKFARDGLPRGFRIPRTEGGTYGLDDMSTEEGAKRFKAALLRLKNGEPPQYHSPAVGPISEELRVQLQLRHAELHLGYLIP